MKVVILAAGQGRRLLPLTHHIPKCLLPVAGRPLLAWQLAALSAAGVAQAVVVTGFGAEKVEDAIAHWTPPGLEVIPVFNPFFAVADNVASCWAAREHLAGEVAVLNGDTLLEADIITRARECRAQPITVTIDTKDAYDADDMKVQLAEGRIIRIGKTLHAIHAESVGLVLFRGMGGPVFVNALEAVMRRPRGVSRWFFAAIDDLAARGMVGAAAIDGLEWAEVDYPGDLGRAELLARGWMHKGRLAASAPGQDALGNP